MPLDKADLHIPYQALRKLQKTPWIINNTLLDTAQYFWSNQYNVAGFPPFKDDLMPSKPHDIDTNKEARGLWRKEAARFYREDLSRKGARLGVSKILWVAHKFRTEAAMYFPHQFDFRGRAYAVPNFLNYQTTDLGKGLMQFAESRPMTDRGSEWFAKAGKNLWGNNVEESAHSWIRRNSDQIHSVASDPKGNLWWNQAEEPWQFLAWVLEASPWLRGNLKETRLPISIDASSNGLQIMSMLSRYKSGAEATNCISRLNYPPKDIYREILEKTKLMLGRDTKIDLETQVNWRNLSLTRKLIKSIIMTIPYGITKYRATELVLKWYWEKDSDVFGSAAKDASRYLASLIIDTFYRLYPDFKKLMDFLEGLGAPRLWTSPSGFPVLQYYHKAHLKKLKSLLFGRIRSFNYYDESPEIDAAKIKRAFIPNFIHSLDASVMHLALQRFQGPCVAAVHDSFATHASDLDNLSQTLKDTNADVFGADPEVFWKKIFMEKPLEKQAFESLMENFSSITGDLVVDDIRQSAYMYR